MSSGPLSKQRRFREAGHSGSGRPTVAEEIDEGGEPLDATVLTVDYNAVGERFKSWRCVSNEVKQYHYQDWPWKADVGGPLGKAFLEFRRRSQALVSRMVSAKGIHEHGPRGSRNEMPHRNRLYSRGLRPTQPLLPGIDRDNSPTNPSSRRRLCVGKRRVPDWTSARVIISYRGPDDVIAPALRSWAARKSKEESDLAQARPKREISARPGGGRGVRRRNSLMRRYQMSGEGPRGARRRGRGLNAQMASNLDGWGD